MMNSFWWGRNQREKKKGINWVAWDRLCLPKKEGGLDFKKLHLHNASLVAKQAWRLLSKPHSLVPSSENI